MSSEPKGSHQQGRPVPADSIKRLKRRWAECLNLREACRCAGISRPTARKYLGIKPLPELDI